MRMRLLPIVCFRHFVFCSRRRTQPAACKRLACRMDVAVTPPAVGGTHATGARVIRTFMGKNRKAEESHLLPVLKVDSATDGDHRRAASHERRNISKAEDLSLALTRHGFIYGRRTLCETFELGELCVSTAATEGIADTSSHLASEWMNVAD
mmetsp:Transcript_31227/g.58212  ORF Transcript_31227/g.58212 Transcript_31227/m.58212 type:complete len:152 (-) Transcript_31227:22-477(-)